MDVMSSLAVEGTVTAAGFTGPLTGNATTATTATALGTATVGSATTPVYLNGGTATACSEMVTLGTAQTISGAKTFSATVLAPTPGASAGATEVVTVGYVSDTTGLNNLVHTNGNETIAGAKTLTSPPIISGGHDSTMLHLYNSRFNSTTTAQSEGFLDVCDSSGGWRAILALTQTAAGKRSLVAYIRNSDNSSYTTVTLGTSS